MNNNNMILDSLDQVEKLNKVVSSFNEEYSRLLPNKKFKKNESNAKREWYKRSLKYRVYKRYKIAIFNLVLDINDQIFSKQITKQMKNFVMIEEMFNKQGDKNDN